jgi:hypothetical protein
MDTKLQATIEEIERMPRHIVKAALKMGYLNLNSISKPEDRMQAWVILRSHGS